MQRVVVALFLLMAVAGSARADQRSDESAVVAILPFTTADRSLALYSKAAATALAGELKALEGVTVQTVSLNDSPPSSVALVIDGRILPGERDGTVKLELTVRDPEFGVAVGTVSTRVAPLGEIDVLVGEAGRGLPRLITRAMSDKHRRRVERERPIRLRPTVVEGTGDGTAADGEPRGEPPRLVVLTATSDLVIRDVAIVEIATRAARGLAADLGYQPVSGGTTTVSSHRDAGAVAAKVGAAGALRVHIEAIHFEWHGVLTARGVVRVVLTGADGGELFDRTVRTDTIVGSRGDRFSAVIRMMCNQAMDIAAPPIRRGWRRE